MHEMDTDEELVPGHAQAVGETLRAILRGLHETMQDNVRGAREGAAPKYLHDFRVALRRTRTVISRLRGALPSGVRDRFASEFKWLGAVTGDVRDLDVHLSQLPAHAAALPDGVGADMARLGRHLERQRAAAQQKLNESLSSARYRDLTTGWRSFLEQLPADYGPDAPDALRPVKEVASVQIWRIYCECLERAQTIDERTADEELHELRKDCKKLRYLLEFFRHLFPPADMDRSIGALKKLQDVLGSFNDLSMQRQAICRLRSELQHESAVSEPTRVVADLLMARLEEWLTEERGRFQAAFTGFASEKVDERFRQLFASDPLR
ncbi:MAG: CHAD domain-containing protein [Thermoanaerobaculia bacterium]|nr:CHAD domain-containing protein [Thermoanaerobaculia bacterium]